MNTQALVPNIEKILQRLTKKNSRTQPDALLSAAFGDTELLANALWTLVREGKGGLVGCERAVISVLGAGSFNAHDFLSLLRQLNAANLFWFEQWDGREDGLAYYGWSKELEVLLDNLLATTTDRTPLEWADVSEPAGSALLFALGRRGIVDARTIPPDALPRFAKAFLGRAGWCAEQFAGWERLWPPSFFARATFACVYDVKEVCVFPKELAPLVEYATPTQLAALVDKMIWVDESVIDWLVSRGKVMIPQLNVRVEPLLALVRKGEWLEDAQGIQLAALAKLRAQNKDAWPISWLALAKMMLENDVEGLDDVLAALDEPVREKLLLEHLSKLEDWSINFAPFTRFPTQNLVDALVEIIRTRMKSQENDLGWSHVFEMLGQMGSAGQTALATLIEEPKHAGLALEHLIPTPQNVTKTIDIIASSNEFMFNVADVWLRLDPSVRLDLVSQHFHVLPEYFVAQMAGHAQHLLKSVEVAQRLPDTKETHNWRELILHPPEPLRRMRERIGQLETAALERAQRAFADYRTTIEGHPFDMEKVLAQFGPDDLPAVVAATAFRLGSRFDHVEMMCRHFWPACPEIPWIAVFWWGMDESSTFTVASKVMGPVIMPALVDRIESRVLAEDLWLRILDIFTQWDPLGGFEHYTRFSSNWQYELRVQAGLQAVLALDRRRVVEWLEESLLGKQREFALRFLCTQSVPEVVPTLQKLENVKLPVKLQKKWKYAIEAQKILGGKIPTSNRTLAARLRQRIDGSIEAFRASSDGQTWLAYAGENITVWKGDRETTILRAGRGAVELSLDGRFVLVLRPDGDVDIYDPWTNVPAPVRTLHAGPGTSLVIPMPGGRACTVCPAIDARNPLMLWDLETGDGKAHRVDGLPAYATWLDEHRYVVGTTDEKITIRQLDTGKIVGKLHGWENHHGGGVCKLAAGHGGKIFATLFMDGTLMIWSMSESQNRGLGRHGEAAPRALVADPGSSWMVTPSAKEVLTWKEGRPARSLVGSGQPPLRSAQDLDGTGWATFVRPNVVAIGGEHVDVWDLEASRHMGRWDKPVTALISLEGKLVAGDAEGNIWEVDVE